MTKNGPLESWNKRSMPKEDTKTILVAAKTVETIASKKIVRLRTTGISRGYAMSVKEWRLCRLSREVTGLCTAEPAFYNNVEPAKPNLISLFASLA